MTTARGAARRLEISPGRQGNGNPQRIVDSPGLVAQAFYRNFGITGEIRTKPSERALNALPSAQLLPNSETAKAVVSLSEEPLAQIQFCGPSYASQSPTADAEVCRNLYPELIEGSGKGQYALYPTPGLQTLVNLGINQPVDAMPIMLGASRPAQYRLFAICGTAFIELTLIGGVWATVTIGNFASNNTHKVFWAYGNRAITMVVDGTLYYFLDSGTFGSIPAATFGGAGFTVTQTAYVDGFFLALVANVGAAANQIYASAPLDPTTWPGASTAIVSVFPDGVLSMIVNQRQPWLLGQTASVVYFNSGNSPFPLDVIAGSYIEAGCVAAAAVAKMDNSLFWLDADQRGQAIVRRANGYTPQRVSNHAVEFAMQGYPRIDDAYAYAYQDQGHSFYVLTFPSANSGNGATWVYDVATNMWHERSFLNNKGVLQAHRSRCHVTLVPYDTNTATRSMPIHLVGDSQATGNIYQMQIPAPNGSGGWNFATDFGNPIQRVRRAPVINIEQEWMTYSEFSLDVETGLGPIPPLTGASTSQPVMYLADSTGVIWSVTIPDGGGSFVTTPGGTGPAETVILNDSTTNTTSRQLGVTTLGVVTATIVTFLGAYPQTFKMATSGSLLQTGIQVQSSNFIQILTPSVASRDPQIMLRFSKDNSHTWSNYFNLGAGQAGNYLKRVVHRRMGRARQMTFEVSSSEPIPIRIVNAYLRATSYGPEERLVRKLGKSA